MKSKTRNELYVLTGDSLGVRTCGHMSGDDADAALLWDSIYQQLFTLPDATMVYPGHDFQGRMCSTIAEERSYNPRLSMKSREEFTHHMSYLDLPRPKNFVENIRSNLYCGLCELEQKQIA